MLNPFVFIIQLREDTDLQTVQTISKKKRNTDYITKNQINMKQHYDILENVLQNNSKIIMCIVKAGPHKRF